MHRVAIYAREEAVVGAQGRLDAQVATVAGFVRRRGGWHVATYGDLCSGATLERPGLAELVAYARAGWFDVIVVECRERVAPDPAARRLVGAWLGAAGVTAVVMRPPGHARLARIVATLALVDLVEAL